MLWASDADSTSWRPRSGSASDSKSDPGVGYKNEYSNLDTDGHPARSVSIASHLCHRHEEGVAVLIDRGVLLRHPRTRRRDLHDGNRGQRPGRRRASGRGRPRGPAVGASGMTADGKLVLATTAGRSSASPALTRAVRPTTIWPATTSSVDGRYLGDAADLTGRLTLRFGDARAPIVVDGGSRLAVVMPMGL